MNAGKRLGVGFNFDYIYGRGYYQSSDLDEISYQYRQDTSRAMSILKRRKPMRDLLKEAGRSV